MNSANANALNNSINYILCLANTADIETAKQEVFETIRYEMALINTGSELVDNIHKKWAGQQNKIDGVELQKSIILMSFYEIIKTGKGDLYKILNFLGDSKARLINKYIESYSENKKATIYRGDGATNQEVNFWALFSKISACAKSVLDVESKALESNIFKIFSYRNYPQYIDVLSRVISEIKTLSEQTSTYHVDYSVANTSKSLMGEITAYAGALKIICNGLNLKSQGGMYSHSQYSSDLQLLEISKLSCSIKQSELLKKISSNGHPP